MGRLTDNLLAVLGVKPSDRVKDCNTAQNGGNSKDQNTVISGTSPINDFPSLGVGEEDTVKADCISCKAVGTTTMLSTSAFILYYTFKNAKTFTGVKRTAAYLQGLSLSTFFTLLAVSRAFDLGPFDQTQKDVPITQRIKNELEFSLSYIGINTSDSAK